MSKKKLAIISSYDDFCGNASYTKALANEMKLHYDVTVLSLDVDCLQKANSKYVDKHVKQICNQLDQFDYVNIQFEAGLFGSTRSGIKKNFFAIAKACKKKLVLTIHRIHGRQELPTLGLILKLILEFKYKRLLSLYKNIIKNNCWAKLYEKTVKFCKSNQVPIVVHTRKDKNFIRYKFDYNRVYDHPLCFYSQDEIANAAKTFSRKEFCELLHLNENHTYIGIFGFINKIKGHATVIKALEHLPKNYELIIFGSQHPHSIMIEQEINEYINELLIIIKNLDLSHRVKFYRTPNDDEFLKALLFCDFNVLPYLEVNQGGSGIAALTLETNSKAIFSQNFAFFELAKYAPNAFKMFSIGNHLELAHAILSYRKSDFESHLKEYHKQYNPSSSASLYQRLLSRTM